MATVPDPASPLRDPDAPTLPPAATGAGTTDLLIQGHTYDGIREYDNPMPGWWVAIFWATILFTPVYILGVHVFGWIDSYEDTLAGQAARVEAIQAEYAATGPAFKTDPGALREYAADPVMVTAGAVVYGQTCASCHGAAGEGGIGPNLADAFWIHGGAPEDVYRIIAEGVPANGMPAWDGSLSPEQQAQTTAFVLSLVGTDPPNAKAPEGDAEL